MAQDGSPFAAEATDVDGGCVPVDDASAWLERAMESVEAAVSGQARGPGGFLGNVAAVHVSGGGKRLRARCALRAAQALGVPTAPAVTWAAAVELLHEASLVHDDLQDGDRVRRGRPTVWVEHGSSQAINAGDLLLLSPFELLERIDDAALRGELTVALAKAGTRMARGQASEPFLLEACRRGVGREAYLSCIRGKTGAVFGVPVTGAALLSGLRPAHAAELGRPFEEIGQLFQIVDDVLDLFGDKGRDKVGNDVREGKISALVVEHLERRPQDTAWLLALLERGRDDTKDADVEAVRDAFVMSGALGGCLDGIHARSAAVLQHAELCARPGLWGVAAALVERTLDPIRHVAHDQEIAA